MPGGVPVCYVIAGQNGAGKSTLTSAIKAGLNCEILDPDIYVKEHGGDLPGGKRIIARASELIRSRRSFLLETTGSGRTWLNRLRRAKDAGFEVQLHFVSVQGKRLALERVRQRMLRGGHAVSESHQDRRFLRCTENAVLAAGIADRT